MPNYKYQCIKCLHEFREVAKIEDCDKPCKCPECSSDAARMFEGTTNIKYHHRSNVEKAIHADLVEANQLEREAAYSGTRRNVEDQTKLAKEIDKLKFTN